MDKRPMVQSIDHTGQSRVRMAKTVAIKRAWEYSKKSNPAFFLEIDRWIDCSASRCFEQTFKSSFANTKQLNCIIQYSFSSLIKQSVRWHLFFCIIGLFTNKNVRYYTSPFRFVSITVQLQSQKPISSSKAEQLQQYCWMRFECKRTMLLTWD